MRVLELGCGPGFYACKLARRFPQVEVTGVDLSARLVERARNRASMRRLENCDFQIGDAQALAELHETLDAVVLSRLFLIVPDKQAVLSEVFRILRPGGRCFIAEPTSSLKTLIPLGCMWILSRLSGRPMHRFREPIQAVVMRREDFEKLIHSQPWASVALKFEGSYQYAVCTKDADCSQGTVPAQVPRPATLPERGLI